MNMDDLYNQIDEIYRRALQADEMTLALRCIELKLKILKGVEVDHNDLSVSQMDELTLEKLIAELESKE